MNSKLKISLLVIFLYCAGISVAQLADVNPLLNKVCLDASNGCADNCRKRAFSFMVLKDGSRVKQTFDCCLCEVDPNSLDIKQLFANNEAECPYDENCMSQYACGAYLEQMVINGVELNCQKCEVCGPESWN